MRKKDEITRIIKGLEESILEVYETFDIGVVLNYCEYHTARKVLKWVLSGETKKIKKEEKSEKLQKFGIENPL